MRAMLCKDWGGPENLTLEQLPNPSPSAGEIVVDVKAAGVNFADTLMIQGLYQTKPPLPFVPGFELAGQVAALGEGVTHLQPGQRVVGFIEWGAYAEKAVAPADSVMPLPDAMSFTDAAAFAVAYGTAHVALSHRGHLKEGETLLIHGASGGVGLCAVEVGKLLGATVIATASTEEKLELCRAYGADHAINYQQDDFVPAVKDVTGGKGADIIFDPVGGEVFNKSLRCIAWEGRILVIGFASGTIPKLPVNLTLVKNASVVGVYWGAYGQRNPGVLRRSLQELLSWYAQGKVKPHVSKTYPLSGAVKALNALMSRQSKGKIVLEVER